MHDMRSCWLALGAFALLAAPALGQGTPPPPAPPPAAPPAQAAPPALIAPKPAAAPKTVAATVNGQQVMEIAVFRALRKLPPEKQGSIRPEIVNFLVDKALIDQFLALQKVNIDPKEFENSVQHFRDEIKNNGLTYEKVLADNLLSEDELKTEITGQLRWEQYVKAQSTDKALRELFQNEPEIFDGTMVRARHILLQVSPKDAKATEAARVKLAAMKKQMEDTVAQSLAKLPGTTDNLARERERTRLTDEAFIAAASKESECPSKVDGGDIGFFPRTGSMVEAFAQTAFKLKPHQISDVIPTQFGVHLILVTDRKPGKQLKFEEVQDAVRQIYGDRLRDTLLPQLRAKAQIVINPPPKPE